MKDAFSARSGNEGLDFGGEMAGGAGVGERFMPA